MKEVFKMRTAASISVQYDNPFSPFPASEWREGFRWAKQGGLDGVELIVSDPKLADVDAILAELEADALEVATISTGQATALENFSLTSLNEFERAQAVQRCCDDVDFSAALGRPNVTIGLIRGRGREGWGGVERELLKRELYKVADYACKREVALNLEPINRYEVRLLNSVADTAAFLDEMGNPVHIGILYDTFHVNIEDGDQPQTLRRYHTQISHVHFADSNRRLPGEGHIDYLRVKQALDDIGYGGWVSLETLSHPSQQYVREQMKSRMAAIFGYNKSH